MNHQALITLCGTAGDDTPFVDELARTLVDAGHLEAAWYLRGYADALLDAFEKPPAGCADAIDAYIAGYGAAPLYIA